MNLRNYKSNSSFKGEQPWVYPKTRKFKAVVTDKTVFPSLPRVSRKKNEGKDAEDPAGATIQSDRDNMMEILD
jgi:hypothetical protein